MEVLEVLSLEFGVWRFGVWSLEFGVWSLEFGVWSFGFQVWDLQVLGIGFGRVEDEEILELLSCGQDSAII